jgi:conflict system pore-forming effector with SLATT domain
MRMEWTLRNSWLWLLVALVCVVIAIVMVRRRMRRGTDIAWPAFPENLGWADATASETSLGEIYKYAIGFSNGSVDWYQNRRRPKRVAGFLLRVTALVATVIAGLVPLSADLGFNPIAPQVSTVLLALAGLLVSVDGLGGFTSGWVRYMLAQQKIERARDAFLLEWNMLKLAPAGREAMLEKAKNYLLCIGKIVDDETREWATEFQNALKELERARRDEADTARTGALEVTVKNAPQAQSWTLEIDGNPRGTTSGKTQAVSDVPVGLRKIRVSGKATQGDRPLSAEKVVKIEGGSTAACELELN